MASDYGLNFGFRRSDESSRVSEGRFKTPVGSSLRIGSAVQLDPASAGYLKQCSANPVRQPGLMGLLVQEENHIPRLFDYAGHDSYDLGVARADKLSVMTSGAGTKVWLKNTDAYDRYGRTYDAVTMFTAAGLAVGDALTWDGTKWVETSTDNLKWLTVTAVDVSAGYCEAVLTF